MFGALMTYLIKLTEKRTGVEAPYAYHLRDVFPSRLWRYSMIQVVGGNRKFTPADVYHAAGMAAAMVEDCGACVQIHVNLALQDGVSADVLRALVAKRLDQAPATAALGFRYGEAIATGATADDLREEIRAKWGEHGLIELAFTIATARFYPAVKRGMGYAHTCERVVIDNRATPTAKAA